MYKKKREKRVRRLEGVDTNKFTRAAHFAKLPRVSCTVGVHARVQVGDELHSQEPGKGYRGRAQLFPIESVSEQLAASEQG